MKIRTNTLKTVIEHLDRLLAEEIDLNADRLISVKVALSHLAPKLKEMNDQGFSVRRLTMILKECGIEVSPSILRRYLSPPSMSNKKAPEPETEAVSDGEPSSEAPTDVAENSLKTPLPDCA